MMFAVVSAVILDQVVAITNEIWQKKTKVVSVKKDIVIEKRKFEAHLRST
jgi:hypothetical protein